MRIDWHSVKGLAAVAALVLSIVPTGGLAGDNALIGTWRLKSFVREIGATGERYNEFGEHPYGFLGNFQITPEDRRDLVQAARAAGSL